MFLVIILLEPGSKAEGPTHAVSRVAITGSNALFEARLDSKVPDWNLCGERDPHLTIPDQSRNFSYFHQPFLQRCAVADKNSSKKEHAADDFHPQPLVPVSSPI